MSTDHAKAREDRRRELSQLTKARLCAMYRAGVRTPSGGIGRYAGGMYPPEQWRKDEVITSILEIEHPAPRPPGN